MRILAIGDFHGKFPFKLKNKIKKEDFDLIVSPGDYCGNEKLKKLFFRYVYGTDKELWEFIGKKKTNELDKKNFLAGKRILKMITKLNEKIIGVKGNCDPTNWDDIGFPNKKEPYAQKFNVLIKKLKNIKIIDFKNYKFSGFNFIGYPKSTYPGKTTKIIEERIEKNYEGKAKKIIDKINEDNKKYFKKFRKIIDDKTILISHNCPYRTKLDKIKKCPQKGKHYGSWLVKKIIKELNPILVICGHLHENQEKQKLGKTWIVNPGAARDGKAAIIEIGSNKVKNIRFLK